MYSKLLDRICLLDIKTIRGMSPDVLARLTDGFQEPLVRAMLMRSEKNKEQREIIKLIKAAYKVWKEERDPLYGAFPSYKVYPDFMERIQTDIECGWIVTPDGDIPAPKEDSDVSVFPYVSPAKFYTSVIKKAMIEAQGNSGGEEKNSFDAADRLLMEVEMANLRKQLDEANKTIEKLREELTTGRGGINQHLTAVLGLKFVGILNITYTNKKKQIAPVLNKLFGWGKRKLEQELCSVISIEDELELASIFGDLSPEIAKQICSQWNGNSSSERAKSEE